MPVVFLSSPFTELIEYRQAAFLAIDQCGHQCVRMENFPAADVEIPGFCREKVAGCDLVVLILGKLYGTLIPGRDISYTEDEFDAAVELRLPILVFAPLPKAQTNIEAVLDANNFDYAEQKARQALFLKKATVGRLRKDFSDPTDLQLKLGPSLSEHFQKLQPKKEVVVQPHPPEMLPSLCDRGPQVDAFGEAFQGGRPGKPEVYVISGHEQEQHKRCVQRLICFYINYPKKRASGTVVAPPDSRSIVAWPTEDDEEEILYNRLCRRLFQSVNPAYDFPQGYAAEAFCRLLMDSKTPYLRFRHVLRPESWGAAAQRLCDRYLKFWNDVHQTFAAWPAGETPPRILIFFEFKHRFADTEASREFRTALKQVFEKSSAGDGLIRRVLPELPRVELDDLDTWYDCYEQFLLPIYRNRSVAELFPDAPLPMMQAESRLRQLLGMESHAE